MAQIWLGACWQSTISRKNRSELAIVRLAEFLGNEEGNT